MKPWIFGLLLVLMVAVWGSQKGEREQYREMNDFGMNKPHLLFQLGQRRKVTTSFGFGYWQHNKNGSSKSKQSNFSSLRLTYENKKSGLYVDMLSHDGDGHIHEVIQDETQEMATDIKYQMMDDGWQENIQMKRNADSGSSSTYWMTYMMVQNTDNELISHYDSTRTPIFFKPTQIEENEVKIAMENKANPNEEITIQSSSPIKIFGFSINISETFDIRNSMEEVKLLIEMEKYGMKKRKNDSGMVGWENEQIKVIRRNQWIGSRFVVVVAYGQFDKEGQVYVTNSTQPFNNDHFTSVSHSLNQKYFPQQVYPLHSTFLKHILYNLYGGIAFYQGNLYTQNSLIRHQFDSFHSFTPSRLIFPRGFLWDDGFHLSIAVHYNPSLTINMLQNWIRKIDLFGWIAREQIRGFEMGYLMPDLKFIYQDTFEMNPPTLILPILALIEKIQSDQLEESNVEKVNQMLGQNFWKLEKWYRYFLKTQSHSNLMEKEYINKTMKYRWRCKDDCERGNFMGSGLDDYPRVDNQTQLSKQHVDLMSWIYLFSEGLEKIATYLNQTKPAFYYHTKKLQIRKKIYDECLDPVDLIFKDQVVKGKTEFVDQHVTKIGYISLFPFLTGALDEKPFEVSELEGEDLLSQEERTKLKELRTALFPHSAREQVKEVRRKIVEIMMDPDLLMSEDGIRSLSISDQTYGTLDNYWRGPVWMPINYLILRACKKHYWEDESVRELYSVLRERLIHSVKKNWQETGYLFQNYHQGKGNRGYPFYGWSSLIAQIITEEY